MTSYLRGQGNYLFTKVDRKKNNYSRSYCTVTFSYVVHSHVLSINL